MIKTLNAVFVLTTARLVRVVLGYAVLEKMRTGGRSKPGVTRILKNMRENYKAWKINDLKPNAVTFFLKPLSKAIQYIDNR